MWSACIPALAGLFSPLQAVGQVVAYFLVNKTDAGSAGKSLHGIPFSGQGMGTDGRGDPGSGKLLDPAITTAPEGNPVRMASGSPEEVGPELAVSFPC